ncbi:MAG: RecQ family ATP-dependent DNA helicase [Rectinemataceae bacterium]
MDIPIDLPKEPGSDPVADLARDQFGIDYLFPLQRMAIANILDAMETGETTRQLVLFPTGFGKSLCFQLPALLAPGPSVVVYPLLALMNDQERSLERRGIPCAVFRGGMEDDERRRRQEAVRSGKVRIVITNPESLATPRLMDFLAEEKIFHIAIDEAHCVSEWGETFRPSYLELSKCIEAIQPAVVSAFTATASPTVAEAIARYIFGADAFSLVSADIDKPNIRYSIEPTLCPAHTLLRLVTEKPKPLIVFDQSRNGVRAICETIRENTSLDARFYHAGLSREEKNDVETWFMGSVDGVLTATCAYGMGVDKKNIRTVIHYSEPPSVEAYIQESGRGGRDGATAEAVLLRREEHHAKAKKEGSLVNEADRLRAARKAAFLEYASSKTCRREYLHRLMGSELASPCSGCDICDGSAPASPEGYEAIRYFFGKNGRRFDLRQSLRLLSQPRVQALAAKGRGLAGTDPDPAGSFIAVQPTCAGAGILSGWKEDEVRILLREALASGILEAGSGILGKHKLLLSRRRIALEV